MWWGRIGRFMGRCATAIGSEPSGAAAAFVSQGRSRTVAQPGRRRQRRVRGRVTTGDTLSAMATFADDVLVVLRGLTAGHVVTYGEVAAEAGHPGAARAVGNLLRNLPDVPWWRVVAADGRVCPHAVGEASLRLAAEGVEVRDARVVRRPRRA
jgi:methylated-DNA-protein-cysteine methyltransferase-like protein